MSDHVMKSWTFLFDPIFKGTRTSDIRSKKDREFHIRDTCLLQEYDPATGQYTGRECKVEITHIIDSRTPCALSSAILDDNYCVLSIRKVQL